MERRLQQLKREQQNLAQAVATGGGDEIPALVDGVRSRQRQIETLHGAIEQTRRTPETLTNLLAKRAEAQGIEVEALNVGLFAGSRGRLMTREFADHAWSNDQRVHDLTGQPFAADYREKVLTNFGARFDSWMPSLAISAHENRFKDEALRFLRAIHQARYVEALDVSDLLVLGAIAERLGWDQEEFSSSMRDRDLQRETEQKIRNNFLAFKSYPRGGVPLLVVRDNGVERIVNSSLINVRNPDPSAWFRRIAKVAI